MVMIKNPAQHEHLDFATEYSIDFRMWLRKRRLAEIAQSVGRRVLGREVLDSNLVSASYSGSDTGQSLQQ